MLILKKNQNEYLLLPPILLVSAVKALKF